MLNLMVGSSATIDGRPWIETKLEAKGHAVYGDYLYYPAGRYAVEFLIAPVEGQIFSRDRKCAEIEAVAGNDCIVLAKLPIMLFELRNGARRYALDFRLEKAGRLQFRVGVNGVVPLLIDDHRPLARLSDAETDIARALELVRFPDPGAANAPPFLLDHASALRALYDRGIGVTVEGQEIILNAAGVRFLARIPNDLSFVGEVFLDNTYNIGLNGDACVIDVGMNSGLVSLRMAATDAVKEVHSFEPFPATLERARANLAINPKLADKITIYPFALSDRDTSGTFVVPDMGCSGAMTIRQLGYGIPAELDVRDAATVLRPIFEAALSRGRLIIMKIDCEGSEFEIFTTLETAGLLEHISAFMVEWHSVYDGKNQLDLIDPLHLHGFITFDRSPARGNGFFYAVRAQLGKVHNNIGSVRS